MDGTGPEKQGAKTGRALGQCRKVEVNEAIEKLGKGMGLRRKSGAGLGQAKRIHSGKDN